MKYPPNLSLNILRAFSSGPPSDQWSCLKNPIESQVIRVEFGDSVESLKDLCLQSVAKNWERNPQTLSLGSVENNNYFLKELNGGSDLLAVAELIKDDLFWERQYRAAYGPRYRTTAPGLWIQVYMEKHLQEWLEKLKPIEYEAEVVQKRLELYAPYVKKVVMENFQVPPKHEIHHIPLNLVLQSLTGLRSIDLYVNIKNAGDDFSDECQDLSEKDVELLAEGLQSCDLLEFRLGGTKLTPGMAKRLGGSLEKSLQLKSLHLIDCNLSDDGIISFLTGLSSDALQNIEELNLSNNFISSTGAFQLAIVLSRRSLKHLNMRLNPIKSEGANLLLGKLLEIRKLQSVNFSACSLDSSIGIMLCKMIRDCESLVSINLSVNNFVDQLGWSVLEELQNNYFLIKCDLRNASLSATITMLLDELVNRNVLKSYLKF